MTVCPKCNSRTSRRPTTFSAGWESYCLLCGWSEEGSADPKAQEEHEQWLQQHPECSVLECDNRIYLPKYSVDGMCPDCRHNYKSTRKFTHPPFVKLDRPNGGKQWQKNPLAGKWIGGQERMSKIKNHAKPKKHQLLVISEKGYENTRTWSESDSEIQHPGSGKEHGNR